MSILTRRRLPWLVVCVVLIAGTFPATALASSHHTATRTPMTITSTVVEILDEGESWVDDAGIFHVRGQVQAEEVSGDASGSAIVTVNVDFLAVGECTEESCPGYTEAWGTIEVTDEAGTWEGHWTQSYSDVPDEEYFFGSLILHGHGGNAGMTFFGEFTDATEDSVTVEGVVQTMAKPLGALNLSVTVCATEEGAWVGNYLGEGLMDSFGNAEAYFVPAGGPWTHTYNLTGVVTLVDEHDHGSVTLGFVGGAQDAANDVEFASHAWGNFVVLEGTGEYAEFYGNGRVTGSATEMAQCASGYGAHLTFYGESHYN